MTSDYTQLLAERDSWARVGMGYVRGFLRPGHRDQDSLPLRRLAHALRQFDHCDVAIRQLFETAGSAICGQQEVQS